MLTTQDLEDYDELMQLRMNVVNEKNIKLSDIQEIVKNMNPLDGAEDFLDWARFHFKSLVSDTLRVGMAISRKVKVSKYYLSSP